MEKFTQLKKKHTIPMGEFGEVSFTEELSVYVTEDYDEFVFHTISAWASSYFHTQNIIPKEIIISALADFKRNHPEVWEEILMYNDLNHGRKHEGQST